LWQQQKEGYQSAGGYISSDQDMGANYGCGMSNSAASDHVIGGYMCQDGSRKNSSMTGTTAGATTHSNSTSSSPKGQMTTNSGI